jgi:hypothetical protein
MLEAYLRTCSATNTRRATKALFSRWDASAAHSEKQKAREGEIGDLLEKMLAKFAYQDLKERSGTFAQ